LMKFFSADGESIICASIIVSGAKDTLRRGFALFNIRKLRSYGHLRLSRFDVLEGAATSELAYTATSQAETYAVGHCSAAACWQSDGFGEVANGASLTPSSLNPCSNVPLHVGPCK
jgi:hypothetical protein